MSPKALAFRNFQAGSPGKPDGCGGGSRDRGGMGSGRVRVGLSSPGFQAVLTHLRLPPPAQALPRAAPSDGVDPSGRGSCWPPPQLFYGQRRCPPSGPAAAARCGLRATPAQVGGGERGWGATGEGYMDPGGGD